MSLKSFHNTIYKSKNEIDLFYILAGQSNALGTTDSEAPTRSELLVNINNAFIYDIDNYYTLNYPSNNQGNLFASELSFAYKYTTYTGRNVYIEKIAFGGTPIYEEVGNSDWNVNSNDLIVYLKNALTRLKNKAIELGSENPKFALCWIQGERDARVAESADYYDNFVDIYNELQLIQPLDLVLMNVLNSNLINGIGYNPVYLNNVINNQKSLITAYDNYVSLDMNKYTLNNDLLHYDAINQQIIGDDIFNLIKSYFKL